MADWRKACGPPGGEELVHLVPAVEADAKAADLEHPEDLGESRLQPLAVVIAGQAAATAVAVAYQVRRVGQDEIHAAVRKLGQHGQAIAVDDAIARVLNV